MTITAAPRQLDDGSAELRRIYVCLELSCVIISIEVAHVQQLLHQLEFLVKVLFVEHRLSWFGFRRGWSEIDAYVVPTFETI